MSAIKNLSRRQVMRGMLGGAAVTVGLPVLECFLNENGTAFAATGKRLPPCFGSWFFGLGLQPGWKPQQTGNRYTLTEQLTVLAPVQAKLNLYSGLQVFLDGKVNQNHYSGAQCQMTGMVSRTGSEYSKSFDQVIADQLSQRSRFRSIEVDCAGDRRATWSARGSNGMNPSEVSPIALYQRIFGPEFRDPNAANFVPDPKVMVRHSVLSAITDQRQAMLRKVSAADRARLDEYFSSVRDLEQKLGVELEKPAPLPACSKPPEVTQEDTGTLVDQTRHTHQQFAQLIAHTLSCGQTQVFNCTMGSSFSPLRKPGSTSGYHQLTHEEPIDPVLHYQKQCKWLAEQQMGFMRDFIQTLDSIREGDGTLLDRTIVFAFTDHGEARLHSMKNYMVFTAGSGGGRMKTGYHLSAEGDPATRVGLTIMQALDIPNSGSWGTETNHVTNPFSEVLASSEA
jgi:hypothetical protein